MVKDAVSFSLLLHLLFLLLLVFLFFLLVLLECTYFLSAGA